MPHSDRGHSPNLARTEKIGVFAPTGEFWTIGYPGQTFTLKSSKGLTYIHRLLQHPGEEFHALDLLSGPGAGFDPENPDPGTSAADSNLNVGGFGDAGEMLDKKAKEDYRRRLIDLGQELEDANELGNSERAAEIQSEIDSLAREISRAVGLGGRSRRAGSAAERARLNVSRAIKAAVQKVGEFNGELGEVLDRSIRTGSFCSFMQDRTTRINWQFSIGDAQPGSSAVDSAPFPFRQERSVLQLTASRTKFVGRHSELATLRRQLDTAKAGRGSIVMIAGAPGIGKTRITSEIETEATANGFITLAGACYDRADSVPFSPFVEILESACKQATSGASFRRMLGEGAGELARLMPQLRGTFSDIPPILEVSPEHSRRLLLNAFVDLIKRIAVDQPVLIVLDDLHWGDEGSLSLLNHTARFVSNSPVIIVGTYRDIDLGRSGGLAAMLDGCTRLHVLERIDLANLPEAITSEMVEAMSGQEPPREVVDLIHSGSEGNPFFIEELFHHLVERGKLIDGRGGFRRGLKLDETDVPQSLRLIIGRRLARLSIEARKSLDTAAVVGRSFTFGLLEAAMGGDSDRLLDAVEEAEESGLISARLEYPEARFRFSHELVRQAVLSDLSIPRKQRLNLKVADVIERSSDRTIEDRVNDLAHHLWRAGSVADPERTIKYLVLAAKQARAQSAYESAALHLQNALVLLKSLAADDERDRREFELLLEYLAAVSLTNRFTTTQVGMAHARARDLCEKLGETSRVYGLLEGAAGFHLGRGELHQSYDLAKRILELSESSLKTEWAVSAHYMMGHTLCCLGQLVPAHEHLSEASRLRDAMPSSMHGGVTAKVCALAVDAMTLWTLGYATQSLARVDEAVAYANESTNPYDLVIALTYAHIVLMFRRELDRALEYADWGLRLAAEKRFEWVQTALGWSRDACRILAGVDRNINNPRSAFEVYFGSEAKLYKPDNCTVLAECCGALGQPDVGLPMIDEAFFARQETDERRGEPETWRVKGALLLQLANKGGYREKSSEALKLEGEECFRQAIAIAGRQRSKAWELRAAVSLSRHMIESKRYDEALVTLLPVHDWFTEGLDTPDLLEAKAVLRELSILKSAKATRNELRS